MTKKEKIKEVYRKINKNNKNRNSYCDSNKVEHNFNTEIKKNDSDENDK